MKLTSLNKTLFYNLWAVIRLLVQNACMHQLVACETSPGRTGSSSLLFVTDEGIKTLKACRTSHTLAENPNLGNNLESITCPITANLLSPL